MTYFQLTSPVRGKVNPPGQSQLKKRLHAGQSQLAFAFQLNHSESNPQLSKACQPCQPCTSAAHSRAAAASAAALPHARTLSLTQRCRLASIPPAPAMRRLTPRECLWAATLQHYHARPRTLQCMLLPKCSVARLSLTRALLLDHDHAHDAQPPEAGGANQAEGRAPSSQVPRRLLRAAQRRRHLGRHLRDATFIVLVHCGARGHGC